MTTIERIAGKGLGVLVEQFELDLRQFEGKLVAVCADNGSGKSTFLEAIPGAMYRETPSQGALDILAAPEGGYAEVDVTTDQTYRIRQIFPGGSGRSKASVWDSSGIPQMSSVDVTEFDRWAARHMPDPDVFFTSEFAAQGAAPFAKVHRLIDERASDRKDILLSALGVNYLEELAVLARGHANEADKSLSAAKAHVAEAARKVVDTAALSKKIEMLEASAVLARRESDAAEKAVDDVSKLLRSAMTTDAESKAKRDRAQDLSKRAEQVVTQIEEANGKHAQAVEVLARREQIEQLKTELADARKRLVDKRYAEAQAQVFASTKQTEALAEQNSARLALANCKPHEEDAVQANRQAIARAMLAKEQLPELASQAAAAKEVVAALEAEIEALQRTAMYGAFDRIEGLSGRLEHIASWSNLEKNWDGSIARIEAYAQDGLNEDLRFAAVTRKAPRTMEERRAALVQAKTDAEEADKRHRSAESLSQRIGELRLAIEAAEQAKLDADAAKQKAKEHTATAELARIASGQKLAESRSLAQDCRDLEAKISGLEKQIAEVNLERAQAESEHFADLSIKLEIELEKIQAERADIGEIPPDSRVAEAEQAAMAAKATAAKAAEALREAEEKVSLARAELARALADMARHAELTRHVDSATRELVEWNRLGKDLGKNGVQALEIDATGPELATLANELLHTCYGSRWTISIKTSKAASSKKRGDVEGFFIWVMDTKRGRMGLVESYSGGERVLIGEAISLALTIIATTRAKAKRPTLIRDESGAALTEDRGRAYVAMLRMAARKIGAHCVLFVSHSPTIQAMADARILIEDGKIRTA